MKKLFAAVCITLAVLALAACSLKDETSGEENAAGALGVAWQEVASFASVDELAEPDYTHAYVVKLEALCGGTVRLKATGKGETLHITFDMPAEGEQGPREVWAEVCSGSTANLADALNLSVVAEVQVDGPRLIVTFKDGQGVLYSATFDIAPRQGV